MSCAKVTLLGFFNHRNIHHRHASSAGRNEPEFRGPALIIRYPVFPSIHHDAEQNNTDSSLEMLNEPARKPFVQSAATALQYGILEILSR